MIRVVVLAALVTVVLSVACGGDGGGDEEGVIAEGMGPLALRLEAEEGVYYIRWDDQDGETGYKISGSAVYWPMCVEADPSVKDEASFSNLLVKDLVEYRVPKSALPEESFLKELTADVFVLGPDNTETAQDSLAFTAETRCN